MMELAFEVISLHPRHIAFEAPLIVLKEFQSVADGRFGRRPDSRKETCLCLKAKTRRFHRSYMLMARCLRGPALYANHMACMFGIYGAYIVLRCGDACEALLSARAVLVLFVYDRRRTERNLVGGLRRAKGYA